MRVGTSLADDAEKRWLRRSLGTKRIFASRAATRPTVPQAVHAITRRDVYGL